MSLKSDFARLETILKYIQDIETIISHHGSINNAFQNIEGQYSLMMCLIQIGELLNKIQTPEFKSLLPLKNAIGFRNILVHDYEHIDFEIAEQTLKSSIPDLKLIVLEILKNNLK